MYTVKYLKMRPQTVKPFRAYYGDAGWDLYTCEECDIPAGETVDVHTGLAINMPEGVYCEVTGRSSTLRVHHLLVNRGIIDNGYTGELCVNVYNPSNCVFHVKQGMRLGQLLFHRIEDVRFEETDHIQFKIGGRNNCGYGSTGTGDDIRGGQNG